MRARFVIWAAACWAALGVLGFLVYAFGYQLAGLSSKETEPVESAIGWMQVFPVLVGAVALWREGRARTLHAG